ncbi:hypothetical protein TUM4644_22250 [Shewanella colwelliana]|uniref:hypothetical protein n=1 Tax=Shewanella colwelliana TaxID=23 RepID=UPI001BC46F8B|nr:hypothetical protein [Shewanella colwelliana]GIU26288.1 hypothetical protein TUM4644_22250 [Shewanella colwelliana]
MKILPMSALICTGLLSYSLLAAPIMVHQIELNEPQGVTKVSRDENELTQVTVMIDGEQQEFTFTPDELNDPEVINQHLSQLPAAQQQRLAKLLSRLDLNHGDVRILSKNAFSAEMQGKLTKLREQMQHKEIQLAVVAKEMKAKSADLAAKSTEIQMKAAEILENTHSKETQEKLARLHSKEMLLAKVAHDMEAKAAEIEIHFETHGNNFDENITLITDDITALANEIVELEMGALGLDIDVDVNDARGNHFIVVNQDSNTYSTEQIIELIKSAELSDDDKLRIETLLSKPSSK